MNDLTKNILAIVGFFTILLLVVSSIDAARQTVNAENAAIRLGCAYFDNNNKFKWKSEVPNE